jgi:hypothetical protein
MPPETMHHERYEEDFEPTGHAPVDNMLRSRLYVQPKAPGASFPRGLRTRVSATE